MRNRRQRWILLQLVVTCSLFAVVVANCDWQEMGALWKTADWSWCVLCAVLQLAYIALGWCSLALLIDATRTLRAWTQGMVHYAAVQVFAAYTPGRIGEAVLPYSLSNPETRSPEIAASLLLQRVVGMVLLVLFGAGSLACGIDLGVSVPFYVSTASLGIGALVACAAFRWAHKNPAKTSDRLRDWLDCFGASWSDTLGGHRGNLAAHVGVMTFRCFTSFAAWQCILLSFGASIPFTNVILLVCCLNLAAAVPISIAGIGVTDAVMAIGLSTVGYGPELAVALCLAGRGIHAVTAGLWLLLYSCCKVSKLAKPVAT